MLGDPSPPRKSPNRSARHRLDARRWAPIPRFVRRLLLLLLFASPTVQADAPPDRLSVLARGEVLELTWQDAEDKLEGQLFPSPLRANPPLQLRLQLGPFEGQAFEGAVQASLRDAQDRVVAEAVATRSAHTRDWSLSLTPPSEGPHRLTLRFRTTRHKVLQAEVPVAPAPLDRRWLWAACALLAVGLLAWGVSRTLQGR